MRTFFSRLDSLHALQSQSARLSFYLSSFFQYIKWFCNITLARSLACLLAQFSHVRITRHIRTERPSDRLAKRASRYESYLLCQSVDMMAGDTKTMGGRALTFDDITFELEQF